MKPLLFPQDQPFWFETLRALGHTAYGGADINEVLASSQRIVPGDYESWCREWRALAERVETEGRASMRPVTRRDALLRANNYWRSAEFFLHGAQGIAERIRCPTLVCEAEEDIFFAGQPQQLFDHLTREKRLMRFTQADNAGAHCHAGAQRLAFGRVFDWLDATLAKAASCSPSR